MDELGFERYLQDMEKYFRIGKDTLGVELWYPQHNEIKYIEVGLIDVRATDNLRISYSHDRNGWIIEQASIFSWEAGDKECNEDWQEVAFIESWARRVED